MTRILEGFWIAISQLRSNKGRAALTILGVSIGVMVVMVIASMVKGINSGVTDIFEQLGPRTFFVFRHFEGGIVIDDGSEPNSPWRRNPGLTVEEAARIRALPSIGFVVVRDQSSRPVKYENVDLASVSVVGMSEGWPEVSGGDIFPGRSFTRLEEAANTRVVVVNSTLSDQLFGRVDPIGRDVKLDGVPFRVIGVYEPPPDLFGGSNDPTAIIPHGAFKKYIRSWGRWMDIMARPVDSVTVAGAIEDVTALMRGIRRLRPAEENNFSVVTQDKLLDNWNQVTGMFFLVMIALSSVGLMVG
ncbi:MAG: ABC transporter permease, partial [Gemmatimonadales bacterium]